MTNDSGFTAYHSKYFATELTKRISSDSIEKLGASVFNATVDLNPHQLDAALFAFRSPLSRGAILADEVGLGKTIEAGLVISQLWAERKRKILVIAPTILRKQWAQELSEKFFIASIVLDTKEFKARAKIGLPLEPDSQVVICSYQFARQREAEIRGVPWDLVVIDEAHRLRNVFKPSNKIAKAIKAAISGRPLILLTATPLQNSLLELYGLVSFLDEHVFGDIDAFKARYMRGPLEDRDLGDLRRRLKPVCQRTLRRQVQEYVRFTQRIPITQDFTPSDSEQSLYDKVTEYLARPNAVALPASQRQLMTLVLHKLLASSSFAIANTLKSLADRLTSEHTNIASLLANDYETMEELVEEWSGNEEQVAAAPTKPLHSDKDILAEVRELLAYSSLATSITSNAKGAALLSALQSGFLKLEELGAERKAVVFTESRRTQQYLHDLLAQGGYEGRVMTINGTNTDNRSGAIYKEWIDRHRGQDIVTGNKAVDLRAALTEHFRDHADILIATEAASEGVNLQFCSLVVNYDLPWNPQRIEQRIGRCHRYGQKHDVVVINFLNRANQADQRVFQLLSEKFQLFQGVFGSSDEVLGALESGVDFERRVADIYQTCRTSHQIDSAFAQLQLELEVQIDARMQDTRTKLLENFDEEVASKLRLEHDRMKDSLDHLEKSLWNLTRFELDGFADFDDVRCRFDLHRSFENNSTIPVGTYQLVSRTGQEPSEHAYRPNHPLARTLIERAMTRNLESGSITFDYTNYVGKIGLIEPFVGRSGSLLVSKMTVSSLEDEDRLIFAMLDENSQPIDAEVGEKLFRLLATSTESIPNQYELDFGQLQRQTAHIQTIELRGIEQRNSNFFDAELDKLERWADDLKHGLEVELKDLDSEIKQARREAPLAPDLAAKLEVQRRIKDLESERMKRRRTLFDAQDQIDLQKQDLIEAVEARLRQSINLSELFAIRWCVV